MAHKSRYSKRKQAIFDIICPYIGPCLICGGSDKRHRMYDSITSRFRAGDSVKDLATDYDMSQSQIRKIVNA